MVRDLNQGRHWYRGHVVEAPLAIEMPFIFESSIAWKFLNHLSITSLSSLLQRSSNAWSLMFITKLNSPQWWRYSRDLLVNCLQASVKYASRAPALSINTQSHWYYRKRFAEPAIRMLNVLRNRISGSRSMGRFVDDTTGTSQPLRSRLLAFHWLVDSKLSGVRGLTG